MVEMEGVHLRGASEYRRLLLLLIISSLGCCIQIELLEEATRCLLHIHG